MKLWKQNYRNKTLETLLQKQDYRNGTAEMKLQINWDCCRKTEKAE